MAQRILALAAEEVPERLQEALQSLGEGEVRRCPAGRVLLAGKGRGVRPVRRAKAASPRVRCSSRRPLLVAAGRYGDHAGPEGEGDGSFAKRDLQRWVFSELCCGGAGRDCGPSPAGWQ